MSHDVATQQRPRGPYVVCTILPARCFDDIGSAFDDSLTSVSGAYMKWQFVVDISMSNPVCAYGVSTQVELIRVVFVVVNL